MGTIVSGTFTTFEEAEHAALRLRTLSGDPRLVAEFYRSPDGHHVPPGELSFRADDQYEPQGAAPRRRGGPVVAIAVPGPDVERAARQLFTDTGATQVEVAEGQFRDGEWRDYDPESVPNLVLDRT